MAPEETHIQESSPPTFRATTESIAAKSRRLVEACRVAHQQIVENVSVAKASFETVIVPLMDAENAMAAQAQVLGFWRFVSPDAELRKASSDAKQVFSDFAVETAVRHDLFDLVDAVMKKQQELDAESRFLLERLHREYIRNGAQLADRDRARLEEIKKLIMEAALQFRENLNSDKSGIWLSRQELEGVSVDTIAALDDRKDLDHKLYLTLENRHLYPGLRYAVHEETRKSIFLAYANRCDANVALFRQVIILRDEAARILGYPNHASFRLEDKMAKTPETVDTFLTDLRDRLAIHGNEELAKLKKLKQEDLEARGHSFDGRFYHWDYVYYSRLMAEKEENVTYQEIAEYFALENTVKRMLDIFMHVFGLWFERLPPAANRTWHKDVDAFAIYDNSHRNHKFLGYVYLDLYARDGKHKTPTSVQISPGYFKNDTRHHPATALICSFAKPTSDKPTLLQHNEIVTIFHELGHSIHDVVSKTKYARFHGTNLDVDFGEAPSQMLENWCWIPSILQDLSEHYSYLESSEQRNQDSQPPRKIPSVMVDALVKARQLNRALFTLRQLHLGLFDLEVHSPATHEEIEDLDISTLYHRIQHETVKTVGPEPWGTGDKWGHGQSNFSHLMGDYDVGYYGYLSSQVLAADMFYSAFEADPMDAEQGLRYRYAVLEKGGSANAMDLVKDFLGREPNAEAFNHQIGLSHV